MEQQTGSKLGKEYVMSLYCHPVYLIYMQSTSCEMLGWMKHKLTSTLQGEISVTSDAQMTPPLWQKGRRAKEPSSWKWKKSVKKLAKNLIIQKTKIMVSGPIITSWQTYGETMKTVRDFIFLGSKITSDGDYSHEIKGHLLFGRKAMNKLDSILKSRNMTLPTKVHIVKPIVFQ